MAKNRLPQNRKNRKKHQVFFKKKEAFKTQKKEGQEKKRILKRKPKIRKVSLKEKIQAKHFPLRDLKWFQKNIVIKVVGVGGAGGNIVSRMKEKNIPGVEFIVLNTDLQALNYAKADRKLQIGKTVCRGLGAGADPDKGREAAQEDIEEIKQLVQGADLIFLTCGLGGGTGSGASPIVANLAKQSGALVVAFVTKPFSFEGENRKEIAEKAWQNLFNEVDAILTVPNDRIFNIIEEKTPVLDAFDRLDDILRQGIGGIVDLIVFPGLINLDFANIKNILTNAGMILMGIGKAKGSERAKKAAQRAVDSPLLDISIEGAKRILFNIAGGKDMTLTEIHTASQIITQATAEDATVIFGASFSKDLKPGELKVTVIAGFTSEESGEFSARLPLLDTVNNKIDISKERILSIEEVKEEKEKEKQQPTPLKPQKELEIPAFLRKKKRE